MTNKLGYNLWLQMIHKIPKWELSIGIIFLASLVIFSVIYVFVRTYQVRIFHAFEKLKLKQKDLDKAYKDTQYVEITIPKNSQVTAFQVQQKILKAFHSTYSDPIEGTHAFSPTWYFFQKLFRLWKVFRAKQIFFTMQIWAQYPFISFRLNIPSPHFDRIEKAIFNAYPNAEITHVDKGKVLGDIVIETDKFSELRWIPIRDYDKYQLAPNAQEFCEKWIRGEYNPERDGGEVKR